jgi:hypothetical protein
MLDRADSARSSFQEAAAILATGLLRLLERSALPSENPPELLPKGLEVPTETSLSVRSG